MSQENVEVVRRALQRFKESGGEIASEYWLRDGRIYRVEQHGSMREALRSAGLAE